MGVQIPVGYGLVKCRWGLVGSVEEMIVTWGYEGDIAFDPLVDAGEINTIMIASNRPANPAKYSSSFSWRGVECTRMTVTGPISAQAGSTTNGTAVFPCPPPQVAYLLQKRTARGGRMGRGRCFLPPIFTDETNVNTAGVISGFDLAALQTLWDNALTALQASDCPPVLLHADGSTPDAITSWQISDLVATQRRRIRR